MIIIKNLGKQNFNTIFPKRLVFDHVESSSLEQLAKRLESKDLEKNFNDLEDQRNKLFSKVCERLEKDDLSKINPDKLLKILIFVSFYPKNTSIPFFLDNKTIPKEVFKKFMEKTKNLKDNEWPITIALRNPNMPLEYLVKYSKDTPANRKTRENYSFLESVYLNPSTPKKIKDNIKKYFEETK